MPLEHTRNTPIRPQAIFRTNSPSTTVDQRIGHLQRLADWMDTAFEVPGTSIRFGLDALIGLLPGFGDTITSLISIYIIGVASSMGVPRATLVRMATNVAIDWLLGIVPLAGDVFDVYWKANQMNVAILRQHLAGSVSERRRAGRADWLVTGLVALLLFLVMAGAVSMMVLVVRGVSVLFS
ncbi:MAG: DUF4112 domain-containing protein [Singulisphaera sp.]